MNIKINIFFNLVHPLISLRIPIKSPLRDPPEPWSEAGAEAAEGRGHRFVLYVVSRLAVCRLRVQMRVCSPDSRRAVA